MIDKEAQQITMRSKRQGGRIISVGTTSTRTLESVADEQGLSAKQADGRRYLFIRAIHLSVWMP